MEIECKLWVIQFEIKKKRIEFILSKAYPESKHISKMEHFTKRVNG